VPLIAPSLARFIIGAILLKVGLLISVFLLDDFVIVTVTF